MSHIDIDTASISRNVHVDIPIVADAKTASEKILEYAFEHDTEQWLKKIKGWKAEHPLKMKEKPKLTPQKVIEKLTKCLMRRL